MPLDREAKIRLQDIATCCIAILEEHVRDRSLEDYLASRTIRSAVERELTTIGEAMSVLLRIAPEVEPLITNAREIVDFRNLVVHMYQRVEPRAVWTIIEEDLPTLLREVRALLA